MLATSNFIKIGLKKASVFLIIAYYLMVSSDILTTYIATPDLFFEDNFFIRTLRLKWGAIIPLAFIGSTLITIMFIYCCGKIAYSYSLSTPTKESEILFYALGILIFLTHFTYSFFVSINNILSHLYLMNKDGYITEMAKSYIRAVKSIDGFYLYFKVVTLMVSIILSYQYIRSIKFKSIRNS